MAAALRTEQLQNELDHQNSKKTSLGHCSSWLERRVLGTYWSVGDDWHICRGCDCIRHSNLFFHNSARYACISIAIAIPATVTDQYRVSGTG